MIALLGALALAVSPLPARAETPAPAAASPAAVESDPLSAAEVEARLAELEADIKAKAAAVAASEQGTAEGDALQTELDRLRRVESLLRQEREILAEEAEPVGTRGATESAEEAGESEVSILLLNDLRERQRRENEADDALATALEATREALTAAKEKLERANQKRRAAKQDLGAVVEGEDREVALRALRLQQIKSREAEENVHLRTLEVRRAQSAIADAERERADLERRIARVQKALASGTGEGADTAGYLASVLDQLRRARENAERELSTASLRLDASQRRFARQDDPSPEIAEELELALTRRDALSKEVALLDERIARVEQRGPLLLRWDETLRGKGSREDVRTWHEEAQLLVSEIEQIQLQTQARVTAIRQRLGRLATRADGYAEGSRVRAHVEGQREILAEQLEEYDEHEADLAATRRLAGNLVSAIDERTGRFDLVEQASRVGRVLKNFWGYEITAIDDEPITVSSVVIALILMTAGVFLSRRISRLVGRLSVDRFNVEMGAAAALQTMAFYVLFASFTLFALRTVNFPLTAFTVLGGALAIGIGFGSQNVMNNFISGLILMLERPVRAQDVVEVDGMPGTIEHIGARSTQIRSTDGRHIIVPNSYFLESNVVNWTLSDDLIRATVSVGVIYGSPTRLVERLIRQAVEEDQAILKTPAPIIIFAEFGDNSLNFEVYFWVRARSPMQMNTVRSRLRFRIDDLFRENELVIAFPQRDVHLDTVKPLDVRVVRHEPERGEEG